MSELIEPLTEPTLGSRHERSRGRRICFGWLREPSVVRSTLPLLEHSVTQLAPGDFKTHATVFSFDDVTLLHSAIVPNMLTTFVPDPAYYCFFVPIRWTGDHHINGKPVRPSAIYTPGRQDGFFIRGEKRESIGIAVRRARFASAVASLRGVDSQDVSIENVELEIGVAAKLHLVSALQRLLEQGFDAHERNTEREMPDIVASHFIDLMAEAFLIGTRRSERPKAMCASPSKIVRRAIEVVKSAGDQPVSIASLCRACNVGKDALYAAFRVIADEPPTKYFRKRRLMQARILLCKSELRRGAVTRAALDAGLTELGRFSVEYRQLFRESPRATLRGRH